MRKYDVKGLRLLSASVSGQLETARAIRIALGSDLAALETPDAKLKWFPRTRGDRPQVLSLWDNELSQCDT